MLCTVARYQTITGDTTTATATVATALATAQDLLEDELGRIGLLEDEGTDKEERLLLIYDRVVGGGAVYPTAVPITDPGDYTQQGAALYSVPADASPFLTTEQPQYATVTYRGGYTSSTVPAYMERDLAFAAYQLLRPSVATAVPAGVTAVGLGDASMSFAEPLTGGGSYGIGWSRQTLRHRRRRV